MTVEVKRYKILARRKHTQEPWTNWTFADSYEEAVKHAKHIEESGYLARIVDTQGESVKNESGRCILGDYLKPLMRKRGYTQKQLAMRSRCMQSAISDYMRNKKIPKLKTLEKLAVALGVSVDEIMRNIANRKGGEYDDNL